MSYDSIDVQFDKIISKRIDNLNAKAGQEVARLFEDQMKLNTMQGRGFGKDEFDASYSESHTKERKRRGLQTGRVDLRMNQRRIENTVVETTGGKGSQTTIRHAEMGEIFKLHHTGRAMGGKVRSIWPKSPQSIPQALTNRVKETVAEVLRGQK